MTIVHVRAYYSTANKPLELQLSRTHWGFADWFVRRLKPIKESLRGPEVKGVNVVNFVLADDINRLDRPLEWWHRANSFEYGFPFDLAALTTRTPIENIEDLMPMFAEICTHAPWPQVHSVGTALGQPLSAEDKRTLVPFLQWPRQLRF